MQAAFKDKSEHSLDDVLAASLGFSTVDEMLESFPDALKQDNGRFVAMREATRHELNAWALMGGKDIRSDQMYVVDLNGNISSVPKLGAFKAKLKPETNILAHFLPFDENKVYEDLTEMTKIHLPSLLQNVEFRFLSEKIYSYIGNMLLAVNPYKQLDMPVPGYDHPIGMYDKEVRRYYASLQGNTRQQGVRSHVFVVADNAYRNLSAEHQNQSVVISGESGAGKTKSAREVLCYIVEVASGMYRRKGASVDGGKRAESLVGKITMNNVIFEAFGNAKTLRNDNSSRFGKYLELCFDGSGETVEGAQVQTYLLEKSRVTFQSKGERSFHVFYMMLAGLQDKGTREVLRLREMREYRFLGGELGTFEAEDAYEGNLSEAEQWSMLQTAICEMGMAEDLLPIFRILSFILLLGNLDFEDEINSGTPWARVTQSSRAALEDAAHVIQCGAAELEEALTIKKEDSMFGRVPLNSSQAGNNRDSLAKLVYCELFSWLRDNVNLELVKVNEHDASSSSSSSLSIGLLDIFGFESFSFYDKHHKCWMSANSLEQLCINFANESLQVLFNKKVLEADKKLYESEFEGNDIPDVQLDQESILALRWIETTFSKLADFCREAERRDEYGKMGKEFIDVLRRTRKEDEKYKKDGRLDERLWQADERRFFPSSNSFVITHYADDVEYCIDHMIEKNIDKGHAFLRMLVPDAAQGRSGGVRDALAYSLIRRGLGMEENGEEDEDKKSATPVRGLKQSDKGTSSPSVPVRSKLQTVAGIFKRQLVEERDAAPGSGRTRKGLIPTLEDTHMHFVRCVKPNDHKRSLMFERAKVAGQLSSNGVVQAVKLAQ
eukprot:757066-Hanusia_phi.AAC.1